MRLRALKNFRATSLPQFSIHKYVRKIHAFLWHKIFREIALLT